MSTDATANNPTGLIPSRAKGLLVVLGVLRYAVRVKKRDPHYEYYPGHRSEMNARSYVLYVVPLPRVEDKTSSFDKSLPYGYSSEVGSVG